MRIKEVVIDGFKSYATRTVVSGFDAHFNAITGLNGSGKSNILDAICFTLGISNLHQVRVANLQELVYKQGQAGVTKASVTIVFDNSDERSSPIGYEMYKELTITRQVVIGGKNKYLINGRTAQSNQVQNLFHSVQLNVNNPHFLIMQGRITKVLNMKPIEILGMIEEAAGTRMYESKKQSALKTMEKKEGKVAEINRTMSEEISPTLETLRLQQADYIKFQANKTELDRLDRFIIAFKYSDCKSRLDRSESVLQEIQDSKEAYQRQLEELVAAADAKKKIVSELVARKEAQLEGVLSEKQAKEDGLSKELVRRNTVWQNAKARLADRRKQEAALSKQLRDAEKTEQDLMARVAGAETHSTAATAAHAEAQARVSALQRQLQALSAGIADEAAGSQSLASALLALKGELQTVRTSEKQQAMTARHLLKEVTEGEKLLKRCAKEGEALEAQRSRAMEKLEAARASLAGVHYDPDAVAGLRAQVREAEDQVARLTEQRMELEARLNHSLNFVYSDPSPGFDRSRVKGLVAALVDVKDERAATALEVTAGGKLFQVVVDSEETGKQLLQRGKLKRRVTIIPLNRIQGKPIPEAVVRTAKRIGGDANVHTALSLVGYPAALETAMQYVFGSAFICSDLDIARKVTFHDDIRKKSVTLDGDSCDPSGTLSGGSRAAGPSVLLQLQQLSHVREQVESQEHLLKTLREKLSQLTVAEKSHEASRATLELEAHNLRLVEQRIGESQFALLSEKVQADRDALQAAQATVAGSEAAAAEVQRRIEAMELDKKAFEANRASRSTAIETQIERAKAHLAECAEGSHAAVDGLQALQLEAGSLAAERQALHDQSASLRAELAELEALVEEHRASAAQSKEEYAAIKEQLDSMREAMTACDADIRGAQVDRARLVAERETVELEMKKIEGKLARHAKDQIELEAHVTALRDAHDWIAGEEAFFGQPGTDYDFSARNPKHVDRRVAELHKEQASLSKGINRKVVGMLEKAEQDYNELLHKRRIIEKDKQQIELVIAELDEKKNEVLQTTWLKVNKDFGSIFSTLLPGTDAKLQPVEGTTVLDGLEVKVAFGGKYKESLTELSGDEVDAALDLSHTQNIGQIIKKHFSNSQFIVVSLKEGMFSNANVIFRTKFVDGVSCVTRSLGAKGPVGDGEDEENEEAPVAKKARKRGPASAKA